MSSFTKVVLYTGAGGRAAFREDDISLDESNPNVHLSSVIGASGIQLRRSPVGFKSAVHVTGTPQWVYILSGAMEIVLLDGSSRVFKAGEHFYSADTLPEGAVFDPKVHGHWSRQVGDEPLVTLFVKD
ncbi:hypothetical protein ACDA63_04640 [Uliginosibacterium sp. sgz301328]|uniref:hypothetical protein n=1 Tax=Uliginosibacterium sp. sgz301328 TaxID=3243764 RepID=UPI00359D9CFA